MRLTSSVSVKSSHSDSEQSTNSKELVVGLAETSAKFKNDEQNVVDNKGPFTSVSISSDTEGNRANGTEHKHECDTPGDVFCGFSKFLSKVGDCQRDGEEIEGCGEVSGNSVYSIVIGIDIPSQVQAMNATVKKSHCCLLSILKRLMGLATLVIGGLSVEKRVAMYLPAVIRSSVSPVAGMCSWWSAAGYALSMLADLSVYWTADR
jgi:hypothetical protein